MLRRTLKKMLRLRERSYTLGEMSKKMLKSRARNQQKKLINQMSLILLLIHLLTWVTLYQSTYLFSGSYSNLHFCLFIWIVGVGVQGRSQCSSRIRHFTSQVYVFNYFFDRMQNFIQLNEIIHQSGEYLFLYIAKNPLTTLTSFPQITHEAMET